MHIAETNHPGRAGVQTAIGVGPMVDRMWPDYRFALGAVLATTMLGVMGLGLVMSVRLVQEARDGTLDASRSLAFAEPAAGHGFYEPPPEQPLADTSGAADEPGDDIGIATPAVVAPAADTATPLPAAASLDDPGDHAADAPVEASAESTATASAAVSAPDPAAAEPSQSDDAAVAPPPAPLDRIANAPDATPTPDVGDDTAPPQRVTGPVRLPPEAPGAAKPVKHVRIVRHRPVVHHVAAQALTTSTTTNTQQSFAGQGYWTDSGQWQSTTTQQFATTATAKRARTRVSNDQTSRPPAGR